MGGHKKKSGPAPFVYASNICVEPWEKSKVTKSTQWARSFGYAQLPVYQYQTWDREALSYTNHPIVPPDRIIFTNRDVDEERRQKDKHLDRDDYDSGSENMNELAASTPVADELTQLDERNSINEADIGQDSTEVMDVIEQDDVQSLAEIEKNHSEGEPMENAQQGEASSNLEADSASHNDEEIDKTDQGSLSGAHVDEPIVGVEVQNEGTDELSQEIADGSDIHADIVRPVELSNEVNAAEDKEPDDELATTISERDSTEVATAGHESLSETQGENTSSDPLGVEESVEQNSDPDQEEDQPTELEQDTEVRESQENDADTSIAEMVKEAAQVKAEPEVLIETSPTDALEIDDDTATKLDEPGCAGNVEPSEEPGPLSEPSVEIKEDDQVVEADITVIEEDKATVPEIEATESEHMGSDDKPSDDTGAAEVADVSDSIEPIEEITNDLDRNEEAESGIREENADAATTVHCEGLNLTGRGTTGEDVDKVEPALPVDDNEVSSTDAVEECQIDTNMPGEDLSSSEAHGQQAGSESGAGESEQPIPNQGTTETEITNVEESEKVDSLPEKQTTDDLAIESDQGEVPEAINDTLETENDANNISMVSENEDKAVIDAQTEDAEVVELTGSPMMEPVVDEKAVIAEKSDIEDAATTPIDELETLETLEDSPEADEISLAGATLEPKEQSVTENGVIDESAAQVMEEKDKISNDGDTSELTLTANHSTPDDETGKEQATAATAIVLDDAIETDVTSQQEALASQESGEIEAMVSEGVEVQEEEIAQSGTIEVEALKDSEEIKEPATVDITDSGDTSRLAEASSSLGNTTLVGDPPSVEDPPSLENTPVGDPPQEVENAPAEDPPLITEDFASPEGNSPVEAGPVADPQESAKEITPEPVSPKEATKEKRRKHRSEQGDRHRSSKRGHRHQLERTKGETGLFNNALSRAISKASIEKESHKKKSDLNESKSTSSTTKHSPKSKEKSHHKESDRNKRNKVSAKASPVPVVSEPGTAITEKSSKDDNKESPTANSSPTSSRPKRGGRRSSFAHSVASEGSTKSVGSSLLKTLTSGESNVGGPLLLINMTHAGGSIPEEEEPRRKLKDRDVNEDRKHHKDSRHRRRRSDASSSKPKDDRTEPNSPKHHHRSSPSKHGSSRSHRQTEPAKGLGFIGVFKSMFK